MTSWHFSFRGIAEKGIILNALMSVFRQWHSFCHVETRILNFKPKNYEYG
jgi:hypothetical protein